MEAGTLQRVGHLIVPGIKVMEPRVDMRMHNPALDVLVGQSGLPGPADDEDIVEMVSCSVVGFGTLNGDGAPPLLHGHTDGSRLVQLFEGYAWLLLTQRRLVGSILVGETVLGDVDMKRRRVLMWTYDYDELASITLRRKRSIINKLREDSIALATPPHLMSTVILRADQRPQIEMMRAIVDAAATWRSRDVDAMGAARLERVRNGEWDGDGDDLVAWLSDPDAAPHELEAQLHSLPERQRLARASAATYVCLTCDAPRAPEDRHCAECGTPLPN